jgi:hypothetical protein
MAAQVVIMMGRKRKEQACAIAGADPASEVAFRIEREIDHHDGVLLDDADQQQDAQEGDEAELGAGRQQREQRPTPAEGSVERMVSGWL